MQIASCTITNEALKHGIHKARESYYQNQHNNIKCIERKDIGIINMYESYVTNEIIKQHQRYNSKCPSSWPQKCEYQMANLGLSVQTKND